MNRLAVQLVRSFDSDGNGLLTRREFDDLVRASPGSGAGTMTIAGGLSSDENHDGWIDLEEVQAFCRFQIGRGLPDRRLGGLPFAPPMTSGRVSATDTKRFKEMVDNFWENGITNAARQTRRPGFTPPAAPIPVQPK